MDTPLPPGLGDIRLVSGSHSIMIEKRFSDPMDRVKAAKNWDAREASGPVDPIPHSLGRRR